MGTVWPGNATITYHSQAHVTARKRQKTVIAKQQKEHNQSKATSSLFLSEMIAKLERNFTFFHLPPIMEKRMSCHYLSTFVSINCSQCNAKCLYAHLSNTCSRILDGIYSVKSKTCVKKGTKNRHIKSLNYKW